MHAVPLSTAAATTLLADRSPTAPARSFLLTLPIRRPIDAIFASAIVSCLNEGRRATGDEVQAVAARIWSDIQVGPGQIPWNEIVPGCGRHRRLVAAARVALGDERSDGKPP